VTDGRKMTRQSVKNRYKILENTSQTVRCKQGLHPPPPRGAAALPDATCITAVRTLTLALVRTLAPILNLTSLVDDVLCSTDHCQQAKKPWPGPARERTSPPTSPAPAASSSDSSLSSFSSFSSFSSSAASMVYPGLRIMALGGVAGVQSHR
jgi:hypothetical protein